jgi:lipopolysaccharide export system permease protein
MLIVTLFVAILFVLTRWYRDSEMVVWLASGIGLTGFIRPIARFSFPLLALIAFSAFVGWPWSQQQSNALNERFAQRDDIALLAPGQFRESASSHKVFFIEKMSADQKQVANIFIASTVPNKINVTVSRSGHVEITPNGDHFVVLENGRRYDSTPGTLNYKIAEYQRYGVKLQSQSFHDSLTSRSTPTLQLLAQPTPANLAEFAWRAGLPLMAINLLLLAIPLAYQNPRRGYMLNIAFAVLIFLLYSNLLNLMQSWVQQQKLPFWLGLTALHGCVASLVFGLFWLRIRNRPLRITRWFGAARRHNQ